MAGNITIETVQLIVSIAGLFLVGVGSLGAAWWNLDSRRQSTAKDLHTRIDAQGKDLELKIERVKAAAVGREEVDRLYRAIESHNARIESKMDQGFNQISARVDRLLSQRHAAD